MWSKPLSHPEVWYLESKIVQILFFNSACSFTAMHNSIGLESTTIKSPVCTSQPFSFPFNKNSLKHPHRVLKLIFQLVNCPFMASSYASLNFDGQLRVDGNHSGNPQYAPNSFVNKFRPDAAEAPYTVADNVLSRKSHFAHEGKLSEYDQPRELYKRVMTAEAREHLHSNTANMLKFVRFPDIQRKYLSQVYCIAPEYARGVYDLLPEKKFEFSEVEKGSKGAELAGKERKFRPSEGDRLVGFAPDNPIYKMYT